MAEIAVYKSEVKPDWCPGCGDFGVLTAVAKSASELNLDPKDIIHVGNHAEADIENARRQGIEPFFFSKANGRSPRDM